LTLLLSQFFHALTGINLHSTFPNTPTLSLGKAITAANEALQSVSLADTFALIVGTAPSNLSQETARLRKLATLDKTAYRTAKTRLPYIVGSLFEGGIRRGEHFLAARFLILDIDHLPNFDGTVPQAVRNDASVALAFVSPSGEGFKVLFSLAEPCTNAKAFQAFYKSFASAFAEQTGLVGSVDLRTSDATRACFLAHDPTAYYNPLALPIQILSFYSQDVFEPEAVTAVSVASQTQKAVKNPLNETAYRAVLREVSPNAPVRAVKEVVVPQDLLDFQPQIDVLCQQVGLEVVEKQPIQYGLKVMVRQGHRKAELNVFFGKRGFSVVKSPKTGADMALMDLLYGTIYHYLFPPKIAEDVPLEYFLSVN